MSICFEEKRKYSFGSVTFYISESASNPYGERLWWARRYKLLHRSDGPAVIWDVYHHKMQRDVAGIWRRVKGDKKKKPDEWWFNGKRFKGKFLSAYKKAKTQEQRDAILGFWELQQESL